MHLPFGESLPWPKRCHHVESSPKPVALFRALRDCGHPQGNNGDNPSATGVFALLSPAYGRDNWAAQWNHGGCHHFSSHRTGDAHETRPEHRAWQPVKQFVFENCLPAHAGRSTGTRQSPTQQLALRCLSPSPPVRGFAKLVEVWRAAGAWRGWAWGWDALVTANAMGSAELRLCIQVQEVRQYTGKQIYSVHLIITYTFLRKCIICDVSVPITLKVTAVKIAVC